VRRVSEKGGAPAWQAGKSMIVGSGRISVQETANDRALQDHATELAAMLAMLGLSHVKVCVDDADGQMAAKHLLDMYEEAPPVGVTLVVTSLFSSIATFAREQPDLFRERTVRIVQMGGAVIAADTDEDGEPSGAMQLNPDPAAQNNRLDMGSAEEVYREAQRLSVPLTILSRHFARSCRVPTALFDALGKHGGELGETLRDEQVEAVEELFSRACATNTAARRGLPVRCNRKWFAQVFCKGATLNDGERVWSKMDSVNLYNPLVLLAALPEVEERYLAETCVTVRSATHKIVGMSAEEGSGVEPGRIADLRGLVYHALLYGLTSNASDFTLRDGLRVESPCTIPLDIEGDSQRMWKYDPSASLDELRDLLAS